MHCDQHEKLSSVPHTNSIVYSYRRCKCRFVQHTPLWVPHTSSGTTLGSGRTVPSWSGLLRAEGTAEQNTRLLPLLESVRCIQETHWNYHCLFCEGLVVWVGVGSFCCLEWQEVGEWQTLSPSLLASFSSWEAPLGGQLQQGRERDVCVSVAFPPLQPMVGRKNQSVKQSTAIHTPTHLSTHIHTHTLPTHPHTSF